jgi:hypothetical protein
MKARVHTINSFEIPSYGWVYAIAKAFPYTMRIQFAFLILGNLVNKEQMMM